MMEDSEADPNQVYGKAVEMSMRDFRSAVILPTEVKMAMCAST
jgi:hypothetical protein